MNWTYFFGYHGRSVIEQPPWPRTEGELSAYVDRINAALPELILSYNTAFGLDRWFEERKRHGMCAPEDLPPELFDQLCQWVLACDRDGWPDDLRDWFWPDIKSPWRGEDGLCSECEGTGKCEDARNAAAIN